VHSTNKFDEVQNSNLYCVFVFSSSKKQNPIFKHKITKILLNRFFVQDKKEKDVHDPIKTKRDETKIKYGRISN